MNVLQNVAQLIQRRHVRQSQKHDKIWSEHETRWRTDL